MGRRITNLRLAVLLTFNLLVLTGCTYSSQPLGEKPVHLDKEAIDGIWWLGEKSAGAADEGGLVWLRYVGLGELRLAGIESKDERFELWQTPVYIRRDGDIIYVSIRDPETTDEERYGFWRAEMSGYGEWIFWVPKQKPFRSALTRGELFGNTVGRGITLHSSDATLRDYLRTLPENMLRGGPGNLDNRISGIAA